MTISRRDLLRRTAVLGLVPAAAHLAACADDSDSGTDTDIDAGTDAEDVIELPTLPEYEYTGELGPESTFSYGVASGDPHSDGVILWTHAEGTDDSPVEVWWEVSLDAEFTQRVQVGTFQTDADRDFTVKLEVDQLMAGTVYYYRFKALGRTSSVGRARTAPEGDIDRLRFAVVSCASYAHGYFHAYSRVAERNDLDCVIHLGDYIYEYGTDQYGKIRPYEPAHEILTLEDYRTRYRHYRKDAELQEVHRQHPFIVVWDDHETADNSWSGGAANHSPDLEGSWEDRKAAAIQAYNEWLPIRTDIDDEGRIFRTFKFGNLVDLIMLDTRLWGRDEQVGRNDVEGHADPSRTLLGLDQEAWLKEKVTESTATWKVIGQQVMLAEWRTAGSGTQRGAIFNQDGWDGYSATRDRFLDAIEENSIDNIVVLTGDVHTSWGYDIAREPYDPEQYNPETGEGSIAVEFVVPGVSSPGLGQIGDLVGDTLIAANPHIKYADLQRRGYIILDITPAHCAAEWYHMDDVEVTETDESFSIALATYEGTNWLVDLGAPTNPPTDAPDPAP